ncbi:MAG: RnfABCDGE type electron transport complex subunit B [Gammaproteobacteria bacterium]|nr:RnfABCDGE type electron transport complex subunit B [Gammaproteobacteria bacterium]
MISVDRINVILPQTQCGQCGYKGCKPYAEAIAAGSADINQCPPGGNEGVAELAALMQLPAKPLNPAFGIHKPRQVAYIIEDDCIGCVKCLAACPVDAIIGAAKQMHTVIAAECTGCELCIAPCPVDCIEMKPLTEPLTPAQKAERKLLAMRRYAARNERKADEARSKAEKIRLQKQALFNVSTHNGAVGGLK